MEYIIAVAVGVVLGAWIRKPPAFKWRTLKQIKTDSNEKWEIEKKEQQFKKMMAWTGEKKSDGE